MGICGKLFICIFTLNIDTCSIIFIICLRSKSFWCTTNEAMSIVVVCFIYFISIYTIFNEDGTISDE